MNTKNIKNRMSKALRALAVPLLLATSTLAPNYADARPKGIKYDVKKDDKGTQSFTVSVAKGVSPIYAVQIIDRNTNKVIAEVKGEDVEKKSLFVNPLQYTNLAIRAFDSKDMSAKSMLEKVVDTTMLGLTSTATGALNVDSIVNGGDAILGQLDPVRGIVTEMAVGAITEGRTPLTNEQIVSALPKEFKSEILKNKKYIELKDPQTQKLITSLRLVPSKEKGKQVLVDSEGKQFDFGKGIYIMSMPLKLYSKNLSRIPISDVQLREAGVYSIVTNPRYLLSNESDFVEAEGKEKKISIKSHVNYERTNGNFYALISRAPTLNRGPFTQAEIKFATDPNDELTVLSPTILVDVSEKGDEVISRLNDYFRPFGMELYAIAKLPSELESVSQRGPISVRHKTKTAEGGLEAKARQAVKNGFLRENVELSFGNESVSDLTFEAGKETPVSEKYNLSAVVDALYGRPLSSMGLSFIPYTELVSPMIGVTGKYGSDDLALIGLNGSKESHKYSEKGVGVAAGVQVGRPYSHNVELLYRVLSQRRTNHDYQNDPLNSKVTTLRLDGRVSLPFDFEIGGRVYRTTEQTRGYESRTTQGGRAELKYNHKWISPSLGVAANVRKGQNMKPIPYVALHKRF